MYGMHHGGGMGPHGGMGGPGHGMHGGIHRGPMRGPGMGMHPHYGMGHRPMWGGMWHRPMFYGGHRMRGGMGFGGGFIALIIAYLLFRGLLFL